MMRKYSASIQIFIVIGLFLSMAFANEQLATDITFNGPSTKWQSVTIKSWKDFANIQYDRRGVTVSNLSGFPVTAIFTNTETKVALPMEVPGGEMHYHKLSRLLPPNAKWDPKAQVVATVSIPPQSEHHKYQTGVVVARQCEGCANSPGSGSASSGQSKSDGKSESEGESVAHGEDFNHGEDVHQNGDVDDGKQVYNHFSHLRLGG